jgi:hypothetical protein
LNKDKCSVNYIHESWNVNIIVKKIIFGVI